MTPYHARYFAYDLTRQRPSTGVERLSLSLFDAAVDLNPHQIDAALFALKSPLQKGTILADEVGLGKTIEAGLLLCQYWAEKRRRLLVICPASIRKQWSLELHEKFNLPSAILDSKEYRQARKAGNPRPFQSTEIVIASINFASRNAEELKSIGWDLVVIDEAHKLRNAYRPSNKMGQSIRWALEDKKKILLTATPLQNSLLELYGLSTILDEHLFGEVSSFRSQYMRQDSDLDELRARLKRFCQRTLREQVTEYIRYTERKAITQPFSPTDDEQKLYEAISKFLQRDDTYSIPTRQRQLTILILRKLLASSSHAIAGTLETMKDRLQTLLEGAVSAEEEDLVVQIIDEEEIEDEYLDEAEAGEIAEVNGQEGEGVTASPPDSAASLDPEKINSEIEELDRYIGWARGIGIDTKSRALLSALKIGFTELERMGAERKALIFTESRRTQEYLKNFLQSNGHAGKVLVFNGTNSGPEAKRVYEVWLEENRDTGRSSHNRQIDIRTALIENFRDHAEILIATEAAAEGVNLQFCSLVINYDLPFNPQRIEQRIGRCHRYGQKHDVVVINFLNERNAADRRVLALLAEKFNLFSGIFGASDEVLGTIESGIDFEKRVIEIYQQCRNTEEIEEAFKKLQEELDDQIQSRIGETRKALIEHFDEDVHARFRVQLDDARRHLDHLSRQFWSLTKYMLRDHATFDDREYAFDLQSAPRPDLVKGRYHLVSKERSNIPGDFLYRLSHPLGEHVIESGKRCQTPLATVRFDISNHPTRISVVGDLKGKAGWLVLQHLTIDSFEKEECLLFSGMTDEGRPLDQETCERLFRCDGVSDRIPESIDCPAQRLEADGKRHIEATVARSLETNSAFFREERERLERWTEDMVLAAEKDLQDTKAQIKALNRQARVAPTVEEQARIQEKIKEFEKKKRKQRQQIFDVEDEIAGKRDGLIEGLEKRMTQKTSTESLFVIRWAVV